MKKSFVISLISMVLLTSVATWCVAKGMYSWAVLMAFVAVFKFFYIISIYKKNIEKLSFMLNSVESDDFNFHFDEHKSVNSIDNKYNNALNSLRNYMALQKDRVVEKDAWVKMVRIIIHEIINSITPIISISDTLLKYHAKDGEVTEGLEVINRTSKGLLGFVESYRALMRVSQPNKKIVEFKTLIKNVIGLVKSDLDASGVSYRVFTNSDDIMMYVDEAQISQVMVNVIKNAVQAKATLLKINAFVDKDDVITIEFSNNGVPIEKSDTEQIFVPFFTTKQNGSGIGLSLSRNIMNLHDGSIKLLRSDAFETVFALIFR